MALTRLNTNWSDNRYYDIIRNLNTNALPQNYEEALHNIIKGKENPVLWTDDTPTDTWNGMVRSLDRIHNGADPNPTIGYGINLAVEAITWEEIDDLFVQIGYSPDSRRSLAGLV